MSRSGLRSTFTGVLFWSVISAAFIGPGTVTTAAKAGAAYDTALLWALVFSTLATLLLQEAAARIPMVSGLNLGEAIARRFGQERQGLVRGGLFAAVAFGCAAYQTGNLLGAAAGLRLVLPLPAQAGVLLLGLLAAGLLWQGKIQLISRALGLIVAGMGLLFGLVALQTPLSGLAVLRDALVPQLPPDSELLIIGLIGTTIVPYNLFLGSGLSQGQNLRSMRQGLGGAILVGGLISMVILLVGTQVEGAFSFEGLAEALDRSTGAAGRYLFALGLFAAGFTSSVTAPLAAAVTARGLLGDGAATWQPAGRSFRLTWGLVLGTGLLFGSLGVQPVPAIILAQAINGLLLPLVVVFLYRIINDPQLIPAEARNLPWLNALTLLTLGIALFLGGLNVWRALLRTFGWTISTEAALPWLAGVATAVAMGVGVMTRRER